MRSITQKLKILICTVPLLLVVSFAMASPAYAVIPGPDSGGASSSSSTSSSSTSTSGEVICNNGKSADSLKDCTQTCTYIVNGATQTKTEPQDEDCAVTGGNCTTLTQCDLIHTYINPFVDFLAALVGVAVVISIIIGGIQYSSSAGDPGKASAAKDRIRNAIIALIFFVFLYALLNFLIPGGLV